MNKKFEKIGVEGDDFYLKHYDTNLKRGVIVLNVFSKKDKDFLYNYGLFINDLTFFESNKKQSAKNLLIA